MRSICTATAIFSYEVTEELGSNGTVIVPGYAKVGGEGFLYATANVPSGTGGMEGCLFLAPSLPPVLNADQARFLTMLDRTSYYVGLIDDNESDDMLDGYWPTVSIDYDGAALLAAAGGDPVKAAELEKYLTVRVASWSHHHDDGHGTGGIWSGSDISHVTVDTAAKQGDLQGPPLRGRAAHLRALRAGLERAGARAELHAGEPRPEPLERHGP